ncbi:MAG: response regulator transcription factor [Treponema sp.]|nr:response regulator transcription factor [Treponema sp.]
MPKILIIEDEINIATFIKRELEHEGYKTEIATDGKVGFMAFENNSFDLILLDIMLPEINGIEVLRRIRKTSSIPVILVTARTETLDKVYGLDSGADDYIAKPFAIEELLARIRALLRRTEKSITDIIQHKELKMNLAKHEVYVNDKQVNLTRTEFLLLQTLLQNKNNVISREKIINSVWGENHYIDDNSVDVYIRYLRLKIDEEFGTNFITTVRGVGYTIKD